jgi:hypothetical protein
MTGRTQTARNRLRVETQALRNIQGKISAGNVRLFRNNIGSAFLGAHYHAANGSVVIKNPSRVVYGLCEGSSDLIGWKSRVIGPEDVGKTIAQFVAIEVKSAAGKLSKTQKIFIDKVNEVGGLAEMARSINEAAEILAGKTDGN